MSEDNETADGRCFACKRIFTFDPKQVERVLIDPETGMPPGFSVLGTMRPARPESVARAADEPICPDCLRRAESYNKAMNPPPPQWEIWPPSEK